MIEVSHLSKSYGDFRAVDDINFTCHAGRVTGFLGPNGAGKSTAMRMITGLTNPTSGTATIDGLRYHDIPNPARQVGVLLDASAQHGGRTGREVLAIGALWMGLPSSRVDEMLDLVGLTGKESKRRVRNYSLGMRQRLGIAHALLGDPRVLILDEPANGLDPAGIHWMRTLLRGFAERGGAVMLSSHLLHEIQIIADDLIVIGNGKIVAQGTKDELLAGTGARARARDLVALEKAVRAAGHDATVANGVLTSRATAEQLGQAALAGGVALTELGNGDDAGLEEMFLQLTASTQREDPNAQGFSA